MPSPRLAAALLASLLATTALPAAAQRLASIEVIDRDTGETLPQYQHRGRTYVAGEPGHAYEIAVRNHTGQRLLAVMSVDGVNVLSGETAGTAQGGYVFSPYEEDSIRGWRKNLDDIAQFRFTALSRSYAARTGRPGNVGVIGVALFEERAPRYEQPYYDDRYGRSKGERDQAAPAPSAKAPADAESRADSSPKRQKSGEALGTGHGPREYDPTHTTTFERASRRPAEVITLYYDSRPNLVAAGVVREERRYSRRSPRPFPGGFVPDP